MKLGVDPYAQLFADAYSKVINTFFVVVPSHTFCVVNFAEASVRLFHPSTALSPTAPDAAPSALLKLMLILSPAACACDAASTAVSNTVQGSAFRPAVKNDFIHVFFIIGLLWRLGENPLLPLEILKSKIGQSEKIMKPRVKK